MLFKRAPRTCLEDDLLLLLRRRAYDLAASARGCRVLLDGAPLAVRSFEDYVGLFLAPETFRRVQRCNERWDVALALTDGSGFRQVSFVNSICTSRGGTHVNYVAEQVVSRILEELPRMEKASLSWLESRYSFQSAVFTGRMTSIIQFLGVLILEIGLFGGQATNSESSSQAGHLAVKPQHVKSHLWIFVNCLIENPAPGRSF